MSIHHLNRVTRTGISLRRETINMRRAESGDENRIGAPGDDSAGDPVLIRDFRFRFETKGLGKGKTEDDM